jgi:proton glutamate symport protein
MKHPLTVLAGVALGIGIGVCNKGISRVSGIQDFAQLIAIPGQLYLFYLQMTVIPIVITAITSSLGKLIRNKSSAGLIGKLIVVFVACMIAVSAAGMACGILGKPGAGLDKQTQTLLSRLISTSDNTGISGALEINLSLANETPDGVQGASGIASFFRNVVPSNIFHALTVGNTMAIVFFSLIFGIAIGFLQEESALLLISLLAAIFEAFQKLINWSLYFLPVGLVCLMAGQIAAVGPQIFVAMSKFIMLYGIGTAAIFIVAFVLIWIRSGMMNPLRLFAILFEPMLLGFATRNSMACLPSSISCLNQKLGFNGTAVNLTLPLGMTLGRFGNIFYFGLAVFFVVQIYGAQLHAMQYLVILIGVIFAGTATAGASGIVTLSVLSIVVNPLNLPVEAILVIFMAIDPIIDPFRTFLIVFVNITATSFVARRDGGKTDEPARVNFGRRATDRLSAAIFANALTKEEMAGMTGAEGGAGKTAPEKAPALPEAAPEKTATAPSEPLQVFVREAASYPPLLSQDARGVRGLEIDLIREIAARLDRPLEISRTASGTRPPLIIAGLVRLGEKTPRGYTRSRPWATVSRNGVRQPLCFYISTAAHGGMESRVNALIAALTAEHFLQQKEAASS